MMTNNNSNTFIIWEFLEYLKNPFHYEKMEALDGPNIRKILSGFAVIFVIEMIALGLIQSISGVEEIPHAFEDILDMNPLLLIAMTVLLAPFLEEMFFRFPLKFVKPYFPFFFYFVALLFAFLHAFNFTLNGTDWLMAPLLVMPQLILALYLGFLRMKFDIWASILIHGVNNMIPTAILLLSKAMGIPI